MPSRAWERIEEDLTNEGLEELIGLMRHMILKDKNRSTIHEEFKNKVFSEKPELQGEKFIEDLEDLYDIYCDRILDGSLDSSDNRKDIHFYNLVSLMRNVYPSDEWMLPILTYDVHFDDDDGLYQLAFDLERKLAVGWFTTAGRTNRYNMVYKLVGVIQDSDSPEDALRSNILVEPSDENHEKLSNALDATNFYRKGNYKWPKYLLLRIELARHSNDAVKREYGNTISIEHILPQTPKKEYWKLRFSDEEFRNTWTNRLGNLVPLEQRKNYRASNREFERKYESYFEQKSDLDITNDIEDYDDWNPDYLKDRHENLKEEAANIWF